MKTKYSKNLKNLKIIYLLGILNKKEDFYQFMKCVLMIIQLGHIVMMHIPVWMKIIVKV